MQKNVEHECEIFIDYSFESLIYDIFDRFNVKQIRFMKYLKLLSLKSGIQNLNTIYLYMNNYKIYLVLMYQMSIHYSYSLVQLFIH